MADYDFEYKTAREDIAKIIAQETCGLKDATPEQDDFDLADIFIKIINGERRHTITRSAFAELATFLY